MDDDLEYGFYGGAGAAVVAGGAAVAGVATGIGTVGSVGAGIGQATVAAGTIAAHPNTSAVISGIAEAAAGIDGPVLDVGDVARAGSRAAGRCAAPGTVAHNAAEFAKYKQHLEYLNRFGKGGVNALENGRYRYFGRFTPARNPGEMAGARYVREWDPATGHVRDWYETLDGAGRVRSVAPKPPTHDLNHHTFDECGNYTGRR